MKKKQTSLKAGGGRISTRGRASDVIARADDGPIVMRTGGGPIVMKAGGGPVILRTGGGSIVPRSGRRVVAGGWHPDIPDLRDHNLDSPAFKQPLQKAKALLAAAPTAALPARVDHRKYCSPVENQDSLGSCTAHAVVGMLEYMMRRGLGTHTDLSRLFLYKVTRRLLGWTGDTGAYIRSTLKAAVGFGVPPEEYWPYQISNYDQEPEAFLYTYATNFKAVRYARLDPYNSNGRDTLKQIKRALASGFVVAFGFPVYSSMTDSAYVPFPTEKDDLQGGHAVLAVGYDNNYSVPEIGGKDGCLIFRNSWSEEWGDGGYGYLPYRYVEEGLAVDFWTVFKSDWLEDGQFS